MFLAIFVSSFGKNRYLSILICSLTGSTWCVPQYGHFLIVSSTLYNILFSSFISWYLKCLPHRVHSYNPFVLTFSNFTSYLFILSKINYVYSPLAMLNYIISIFSCQHIFFNLFLLHIYISLYFLFWRSMFRTHLHPQHDLLHSVILTPILNHQ